MTAPSVQNSGHSITNIRPTHYVMHLITFKGLRHGYNSSANGPSPNAVELLKRNSHSDVIVWGGSVGQRHIDTERFAGRLGMSVFNAARGGQGICYARALQSILLRRNCTCKLFIFVVYPDLSIVNANLEKKLAPLFDEEPVVREVLIHGSFKNRVKHVLHTSRYRSHILPIAAHYLGIRRKNVKQVPLVGTTPRDFGGKDWQFPRVEEADASWYSNWKLELYRDFIRAAYSHGIKVVFVTTPAQLDKQSEMSRRRDQEWQRIQEVARRENVPIIYLDEQSHNAFKDIAVFYDAIHLNHRGAEIYTDLLCQQIRELNDVGVWQTPLPLRSLADRANEVLVAGGAMGEFDTAGQAAGRSLLVR